MGTGLGMSAMTALFAAFVIAALFTGLYAVFNTRAYRRTASPQRSSPSTESTLGLGLFWFFLILFLFAWTGALWIAPIGPVLGGVAWLPLIFIASLITLLLIAIPAQPRRIHPPSFARNVRSGPRREKMRERDVPTGLNIFFWILIAFLLTAIVARLF